jgi:hypothetical protein
MKFIWILFIMLLAPSCADVGETDQRLTGFEQSLPPELKGLKIYNVSLGNGNWVKVAVLDGIITTTQQSGKYVYTSATLKSQNRIIPISRILSETDSIIICIK